MKSFSVWAQVECEYLVKAENESAARELVEGLLAVESSDVELNDTRGVRVLDIEEITE